MKYLKGWFFCFLVVFFANHVLPGVEVNDATKLPHIGGDLLFSLSLGLLNSLLYPALKLVIRPMTVARLAAACLGLNYIIYALLKLLPVGIQINSVEGYLLAGLAVTLGSFYVNYMDMKRSSHHHPTHSDEPTDPV